jgi:imidazole glycerol-phosphate synthase subunit HisH
MGADQSTTIVDYGMNNLRSVERALAAVGGTARISGDPKVVSKSGRLVLPGVGAFGDAMRVLKKTGLDQAICEAAGNGAPLLGLCLGFQLLFRESEEFGSHQGLGIMAGRVRRLEGPGLHVPHVGWNQLEDIRPDPLMNGIPEGTYFYFVHSYFVEPDDESTVLARTDYGRRFCSLGRQGKICGAQFHPEKSQEAGRRLLQNFINMR